MATRFETKKIKIGNKIIGGGFPIAVQSMLFKRPDDIEGNVAQAIETEKAGCDILRVSIPNDDAVKLIEPIKSAINIPLVADIHFDYKLAIKSIENGIDKIRINPGNIGSEEKVKELARLCNLKNIPIRIGVNSGSVEKDLLKKYGSPTAEAMVESAMGHVRLLNKYDFDNIVLSIKSSDPKTTVLANRLMAEQTNYPLHLGVTEAGTERMGIIKSSAALGSLLIDDIGDTLRVTLTEELVKEIEAGKDLLRGLGLSHGARVISCPTCGRTTIDIIGLTKKVESLLKGYTKDIKVAVMGCAVNGPGEAREADIGIAAGGGKAMLFKKDQIIGKFDESEILDVLMKEIQLL